jgi:hypothetical protein
MFPLTNGSENFEKPLIEVLDEFEWQEYNNTGVKRINGGFAHADFEDFDSEWVYIQLKWGVQDGDENTVHTEQYKIAKSDLMDGFLTVQEKVRRIQDA